VTLKSFDKPGIQTTLSTVLVIN
jgi:hypothetical protein